MGIFDTPSELFAVYRARLAFRDKLVGGVPKDPKLIEGWLRARAGIDSAQEVRAALMRTLAELGTALDGDESFDQVVQASEALAASKQTAGFKVGELGLYVEARQLKALLKESTNVLFGGERWGATRKGPKAFVAERIFVRPDQLWLGVSEPSGVELMIGHVVGPRGPQSTIGYHEYVERPVLECEVLVVRDCIEHAQWADIWVHAQENGQGAKRSQGFGRFDLLCWEKVPGGCASPDSRSRRGMRPRPSSGARASTTNPCPDPSSAEPHQPST
jgi:hypothetical protein